MKFQAEIIRKYLRGRFSLNDKATVDKYFTNQKYNPELNEVLSNHWNELETRETSDQKDLSPVLNKINHEILLRSNRQPSTLRMLWQIYAKAAAVLLIPIVIVTLYLYQDRSSSNSWVEIHSPYGARTQFSLPDGSTGWLNSGSVIKYSTQFQSDRNISLNGEAYFDVVKNPKSPFLIHTQSIDVQVLGTSFNVVSYDVDSIAEVVVTSGKVEVSKNNKKIRQNLLPNDRLVFNSLKNSTAISVVDVQNYTSWKTGKLIFMNDNLDEVIRKISRFYNVGFIINSDVDRSQLFRAIMEKENLEEVLRYMKLTMNIDYTIQERTVDNEGKIKKKEILITSSTKKQIHM